MEAQGHARGIWVFMHNGINISVLVIEVGHNAFTFKLALGGSNGAALAYTPALLQFRGWHFGIIYATEVPILVNLGCC